MKPLNKKSVAGIKMALWYLVGLILLAVIIVILLATVSQIKNNFLFQKNFVAIDSALIINSLYAAPGNVFLAYKRANFTGEFERDLIFIKMAEDDKQRGSFIFCKDINLDYKADFINYTQTALFAKTNSRFKIANAFKPDLRELAFEPVETTADIKNQQIVIDPGHDESETGLEYGGYKEFEFTHTVARNIKAQGSAFTNLISTKLHFDDRSARNITQRGQKATIGDALISIHAAMNYPKSGPFANPVIAYVPENSTRSKKLASLILNELSKSPPIFSSISLVPVNVSEVGAQNPVKILAYKEPSVLLEIGNLQDPRLKKNTVNITSAIIEGVRTYYG